MKMKKKDAIHKRRKWMGGKAAEEGGSESKREKRDLGTRRGRRGHKLRRELPKKLA